MKIISQSQSPSRPPYYHLAYTAATSPEPISFLSGITFVAVGTLFMMRAFTQKSKEDSIESNSEEKKKRIHKFFKGVSLFIAGMFLLIISMALIGSCDGRAGERRTHNMVNLRAIGTTFHDYASNHDNQFPPSDSWCDAIYGNYIENIQIFHFVDKAVSNRDVSEDEKITSWVMNSKISGDISQLPPDMVVLFKGPKGWNQSGGADLLEIDEKGGCIVLFVDGHIEYVESKGLNTLKWTAEEK